MSKEYKVAIGDDIRLVAEGTTYLELARQYQGSFSDDIVLAVVNNSLKELTHSIKEDCELGFVTTADDAGLSTYRRSMTMLMLAAFYELLGYDDIRRIEVHFSVSSGYYCTLNAKTPLSMELLDRVSQKMHELAAAAIPFKKSIVKTSDIPKIFKNLPMSDKAGLFKYRSSSNTNIYSLGDYHNYFYGFMVPDTSYLKYFKLYLYDEGFALQLPSKSSSRTVPDFKPSDKVHAALKESEEWADLVGAKNVGELNDIIVRQEFQQLILVQEALQEAKLAKIAQMIKNDRSKRFIMIAGPSSSGKTTFSKRICVQLLAHGIRPHAISVDNYYVERHLTPLDENGNYDFENITAIDLELLNRDLLALMDGKEIELPTFNFVTGLREYNGEKLRLADDEVLVIEGIHCLNDDMSRLIPSEAKFKIYISALMMLNLDEHNRIATTDGRLLRRMVRDARTRGKAAAGTIAMWDMVKKGEERFIFPYQEQADVVFNSSTIYELFIMRQYARPLLLGISKSSPEYAEAHRLLKFLDYIIDIPSDTVPGNSILREFIGGGCFKL